jgi:hypothetical protein
MGTPPGGWGQSLGGSSGGGSFSGITGGTNTNSLIVGSGGSITASGSGSIAGVQTAAPPMGFYLSPNCPTGNAANCFYTPANTQQANDCSFTSGSAVVNCTGAHFVAGDVGKRIFGYQTCQAFVNISTTNNNPITTTVPLTIQTVNSSTQVTMSGNATNSNTGGNVSCIIWGTPDDTGAAALDAAMAASVQCPKLFLAAAYYMYTTPHHFAQPASCKALGSTLNSSTGAGNMLYAAGYEVEGRGTGPTTIFLTPGFPETGGCANGLSGKGCFVVTLEGRWKDLMLNGGGNYLASNLPATSYLLEVNGPASLENFTCINFGSKATGGVQTNAGVAAFLWTQILQVNLSACGAVAFATNVSSSVTAVRLSIDNPQLWGIGVNILTDYFTQSPFQFDKYNLICYDCRVFGGAGLGSSGLLQLMQNQGGKVKLYHSTLSPYAYNTTNLQGYVCATTAGCVLDAEDTYIDMTENGTNANTGYVAVKCSVACTNYFKNSIIKGTSGGSAYTDAAGSVLFDMGGNTFGAVTITGAVFNSYSITGTTLATTNVVLSGLGTGLTAPSSASGNSLNGQFTYTLGTGPGANGTATVTFPTPFLQAPTCSAQVVGGSSTTILPLTVSSITTTGMVITYVGTFVTGTVITRFSCAN